MFKSPFSFVGRIRRLEYGLSYLIYITLLFAVALILEEFDQEGVIFLIFYFVVIWFMLAQGSKRCHDLGNSGFYQLIPFYGLWMVFQDGQPNVNKYGINPKDPIPAKTMVESTERISMIKMLIQVSSTVLLNTLLIVFLIEYLYISELILFLEIVLSIILCHLLMLLMNYRGAGLPKNSKLIFRQRLLYSILLYIGFRFYSLAFRGIEVDIRTLYIDLFMAVFILGITYFSLLIYRTIFKN